MSKPKPRFIVRTVTMRMGGRNQIFIVLDRVNPSQANPNNHIVFDTKAEALAKCAELNAAVPS